VARRADASAKAGHQVKPEVKRSHPVQTQQGTHHRVHSTLSNVVVTVSGERRERRDGLKDDGQELAQLRVKVSSIRGLETVPNRWVEDASLQPGDVNVAVQLSSKTVNG